MQPVARVVYFRDGADDPLGHESLVEKRELDSDGGNIHVRRTFRGVSHIPINTLFAAPIQNQQ